MLDVNHYITCSRLDEPYRIFDIFKDIIKRKKYCLSLSQIRSLDFGMKLFPLAQEVFQLLTPFSLLTLPIVDMYLNFKNFTWHSIVLFIFWNILLFISIKIVVPVVGLIAQQTYLLNVYNIYRLLYIRRKLRKCFAHIKFAPRLRRYLRELTTLLTSFLRQTAHFKYMSAVAYYILAAVIESNLFLVLSRPTKPVMRMSAIFGSGIIISIFCFTFILMTELNSTSKRLLPVVNLALVKGQLKQTRPTQKLALAETQYVIGANRFSISLGDIFFMTRLQLLRAGFSIVQNIFLIIDLNDYQ